MRFWLEVAAVEVAGELKSIMITRMEPVAGAVVILKRSLILFRE